MISLPLWRERLKHLDAQLKAEPDAVFAWRWRGETRVLRFLLCRYGEQRNIAPVPQQETTWTSWPALDAAQKWRASRRDSRLILLHIARLNREARPKRANPAIFWARAFDPTNDFWLEVERREIERTATRRERKRNLAEQVHKSRKNKRK